MSMEDIRTATKKTYISRTDGLCDPVDNSQYRKLNWLYNFGMLQSIVGFFVAYGVATTGTGWLGFAVFMAVWNVIMLVALMNMNVDEMGKHQYDNVKSDPLVKQKFIDRVLRKVPGYKNSLE